MKIVKLKARGFGPFRDPFEIDFEGFDDDGVYLIAGPTGAGKSSLLDAIVYGLYGSIPRYEGEQRIRSDLAGVGEPTRVEVELRVGDRELRIVRTAAYERPRACGEGTTTERASTALYERTGGAWVSAASTAAEAGTEIQRLLGLSRDEFLQVILLAQGRFARFLHASSAERKELLRRLFGTHRFDRLRTLVVDDERAARGAIQESLRVRDAQLARISEELVDEGGDAKSEPWRDVGVDGWLSGAQRSLRDAKDAAAERVAATSDRTRDANAALESARALHERHARRASLESELEELSASAEDIDHARVELQLADRAAEAAGALSVADRALATRAEASGEAEAANEAVLALPGWTQREARDDVRDARAAQHVRLGKLAATLEAASEEEVRLPALEAASTKAEQARSAAAKALTQAPALEKSLPAERDAAREERAAHAARAAGLPAAEAALKAEAERLGARAEADALIEQVAKARGDTAAALETETAASAALQSSQARRIAGAAGELAAHLADGEPCAVCGSLEHPNPATWSDPVSAEDVNAAMQLADAARERHRAASDRLGGIERELAAAEGRAGHLDETVIAAALQEAKARHAAALEAATAGAQLVTRIHELETRIEAAADEVQRCTAELERASAAASEARLIAANSRESVDAARTEHPSVAARLAETGAAHDTLGTWLEAAAVLERAESAAAEAEDALRDARQNSGFDSDEALRIAIRSGAEREQLRATIRDHDASEARLRGALEQPEFQDLADAPDLAALETAAAERASEHDAAARASAIAERSAAAAEAAAGRARDVIDELAGAEKRAKDLQILAASLDGKDPNNLRMDIETFVLAARLESIVDAANARLTTMTNGRFSLVHDDAIAYRRAASGLGLRVLDAHTGVPRPTESLSGGESFLASLALALGLADAVQAAAGGLAIETLFVDEGFGALDAETLETAMATLDALRAGGRSVGVISHVQQMQERIACRIRVEPIPGGGSRVREEGTQPEFSTG